MARKSKKEAEQTRQQIIEAARTVFQRHGVAQSTLEQVANVAGLSRGAVYWHFRNKSELFHAMRADVLEPMIGRVDAVLFDEGYADPLDAIEAALRELFLVLDESATLRQVLEIMVLRCEQVDELVALQAEVERPGDAFLQKVERVYHRAALHGSLAAGLQPAALALDTWIFVSGLLHKLIARGFDAYLSGEVGGMIELHMRLRRRVNLSGC
ncbi:MAG: TetR family transcriptional regulator [Gammaproteobacteria bacterium]|nr:TetR family transcriptional regulator [Gammaproteobacteria bacterium]